MVAKLVAIHHRWAPVLKDMAEVHHDGLIARFLPKLAREANERGVVCGRVSHKQWISKRVAKGIEMSYVFPKKMPSRVEMRIYHGKEDVEVESAHEVFKHFLSKKSEIEMSYGGPLNWNYEGRRTAFSIQQDYHEFRLSDDSKWDFWVDKIVSDMKKLDDALIPHYINSRHIS